MCAKSKTPKLFVELIPSTCHFSNVRTTVKPTEWDKIRLICYEAANNKCEICGDTGKKQGYKHDLECHEIWEYDDINMVQKLVGFISLCPKCHKVKHAGLAQIKNEEELVIRHLMKVNSITRKQAADYIIKSFKIWEQRSNKQWSLDISYIDRYV